MEKATFGAGCFWGVEEVFRQIPGVTETAVGYSGGQTKKPTYQEVCSKQTGHAEVVSVTYNPTQVTYAHLLEQPQPNHTQPPRPGCGRPIQICHFLSLRFTDGRSKGLPDTNSGTAHTPYCH